MYRYRSGGRPRRSGEPWKGERTLCISITLKIWTYPPLHTQCPNGVLLTCTGPICPPPSVSFHHIAIFPTFWLSYVWANTLVIRIRWTVVVIALLTRVREHSAARNNSETEGAENPSRTGDRRISGTAQIVIRRQDS